MVDQLMLTNRTTATQNVIRSSDIHRHLEGQGSDEIWQTIISPNGSHVNFDNKINFLI